jgi:hypothetical protein
VTSNINTTTAKMDLTVSDCGCPPFKLTGSGLGELGELGDRQQGVEQVVGGWVLE